MYVPITYTGGKGIRRIHPYDLVITTRGNLAIFGKFVTGTSRSGKVGVRLYLINQIRNAQADRRSRRFINPYASTVLSKAVIRESKEG